MLDRLPCFFASPLLIKLKCLPTFFTSDQNSGLPGFDKHFSLRSRRKLGTHKDVASVNTPRNGMKWHTYSKRLFHPPKQYLELEKYPVIWDFQNTSREVFLNTVIHSSNSAFLLEANGRMTISVITAERSSTAFVTTSPWAIFFVKSFNGYVVPIILLGARPGSTWGDKDLAGVGSSAAFLGGGKGVLGLFSKRSSSSSVSLSSALTMVSALLDEDEASATCMKDFSNAFLRSRRSKLSSSSWAWTWPSFRAFAILFGTA